MFKANADNGDDAARLFDGILEEVDISAELTEEARAVTCPAHGANPHATVHHDPKSGEIRIEGACCQAHEEAIFAALDEDE